MSKGLEALERIGAEKLARGELIRNDSKVEPYYETIEKELKAFDIIKEKSVDVGFIKDCKDVKEYNYFCYNEETNKKLTVEEFYFVMEMLEDD